LPTSFLLVLLLIRTGEHYLPKPGALSLYGSKKKQTTLSPYFSPAKPLDVAMVADSPQQSQEQKKSGKKRVSLKKTAERSGPSTISYYFLNSATCTSLSTSTNSTESTSETANVKSAPATISPWSLLAGS